MEDETASPGLLVGLLERMREEEEFRIMLAEGGREGERERLPRYNLQFQVYSMHIFI